ncbi:hypothetical Protein pso3_01990 [Candidatus Phytoplasma solani]
MGGKATKMFIFVLKQKPKIQSQKSFHFSLNYFLICIKGEY